MRRMIASILIGSAAMTIGAWALFSEAGQALTGRWSFIKSVERDTGTYFRLKVKVAYRGEPVDFDIVVGCNVKRLRYKDGGNTYEAGLVSTVFGKRMADGKGLVVRPPNACRGDTTANGWVPPNFMPIMIVYDDADTLALGTAYISDEAYRNPLSVLTFGGATVEVASRADFDNFRQTQQNLVSRESYHSVGGHVKRMGLTLKVPAFGRKCLAYMRFRIPEEFRASIQALWPPDRPRYWLPRSDDNRTLSPFRDAVHQPFQRDDGGKARATSGWPYPEYLADGGVAAKEGGGRLGPPKTPSQAAAPAFYPATTGYSAHDWPPDRLQWRTFVDSKSEMLGVHVDFKNGQTLGLATCAWQPVIDSDVPDYNALVNLWYAKPGRFDVDGILIRGAPINAAESLPSFFEDDRYYFRMFQFWLDTPGGDV